MKIAKHQTEIKIIEAKKIIDGFPDRFNYQFVESKLRAKGLNPMIFYSFVFSGAVNIITRGRYEKSPSYYGMNVKNIYDISRNEMKRKRELSKSRLSVRKVKRVEDEINNNYPSLLNEQDCIYFLKKLGYKILKPISEYKEI